MSYEILGLAYSRIGDFLIDRFQNQDARIFLYAEAEPGVMGEGVYLGSGLIDRARR